MGLKGYVLQAYLLRYAKRVGILTTFYEVSHFLIQLQKSLRYSMGYCCNVLYSSEF